MSNLDCLTERDEVKFVISNRGDYDFAREFIREHGLERRAGQVLLSPAFSKTPTGERSTENCCAGSAGAGGVDAGGWGAGSAEPTDSQVRLGAAEEGSLTRQLFQMSAFSVQKSDSA